ncbi:VOC family protein [Fodinibius sediminis]|uniref:Glyoxalase superfamily enzyme, possibly 3-demethylubiquinone-9 3-methyltransferase n=1 Tax=Fodinibius sediminis TaxID=1214077 RepID=A0A521BGH4_9BACT|nr:VOC family protein [Fodinibius sediminis]SMO46051.1 Glyoxalase superfamily enzyme, possibly 3-demethylubiquinone-9 3-methyltransferase [Fodinibius sediminis]
MTSTDNNRIQKIIPHLWFDDQAEEAATFYTSIFDDSKIANTSRYTEEGYEIHGQEAGTVMTVDFELAGLKLIALNGGPHFSFTPAISFFVTCESETEVDSLWQQLSEGGTPLMPLKEYGWSEKYGWTKDKYGLSWQISLGRLEDVHGQKITPSLMFVSNEGQAEEAINLYTSLFDDSDITGILRYGAGENQPEGTVMHSQFCLNNGEVFMAMDSSPDYADFTFSEAISLMIQCKTQEEIDHFWSLSTVPEAEQCGWLKDKFGVSWQVSPVQLSEMLNDPNPEKVKQVTKAFLQMKKFDLDKLREAYRSA